MSPRARARARIVAFAVLCALQLGAAASGIVRYEHTLAQGEMVLFSVVPADPSDPFRGRYVQLNFAVDQSAVRVEGTPVISYDEPGYAVLHTDANGFAVIDYATRVRPSSGLFLKVRLGWPVGDGAHVTLPFDRYFMAEGLAPAAERAYRETAIRLRNATDGASRSFAIVRILDGVGVLEGVMLDGEPIETAASKRR